MHSRNLSQSEFDRTIVNRLDRMQVSTAKPPTGLSRPKSRPLLLKSTTQAQSIPISTKLVPHPPALKKASATSGPHVPGNMRRPTPPSTPKGKTLLVRKFYDVKKEDLLDEDRVCGDGEDSVDGSEAGLPSWEKERLPGDGCFSDIAEEDEDAEGQGDDDDFAAEEDDEGIEDLGDDDCFECDELDEAGFSDDGDDTASQYTQSSAANSRASTAKSRIRATSARTRMCRSSTNTSTSGRKSVVGMSKPPSQASSVTKNNNWVTTDEDQGRMKPPLVPSLFTHRPPTIYFTIEGEKVAPLPSEVRKLLKWKMSSITPNIIKQCIARSGFKPTKRSNDWLGYWGKHMKANCFKSIREYQKVNHFPGTFQIGRKDRLWRNLSRMMVHHGRKEYGFVPQTFVLPYDLKLLRRVWDDGGSRQKWILKPPASARGIGIRVIHKWNQIPRKRPVVVQRYLHKPFLINGSKFDLRIYVYVSNYDPLRVYVFEDGLVRFATCKYSTSMKNLSNKFMHLTNYSINKKNEGAYKANSDETVCQGHKWSLKALWGYMKRMGINHSHVWDGIKDVVVKTIIASDSAVNTLIKQNVRRRYCVHELFGFDIMLDENLKPWLLEVNISPSLHSTSQLDKNIKGQMIKDLFNIAGLQIPENVVTASTSSMSSINTFSQEKSVALRSDERAKRAFYIQRFLDEQTKQTILDVLTPDDINILMETEDEYSRRGCFQRAFPSPTYCKYLRFFETQRYYNILLDEWTRKFMREGRSSALGVAILQGYAEQKLHLGHVVDPTHQWSVPQGITCRSSSAPAAGLDQGPIKASSSAPVLLPKIKKKSTKTNSTKTPSSSTASSEKTKQMVKTRIKSTI